METPKIIVLLGAPGAGKGTQAARLSAACGIPHVSTGDLFRANLKQGTALGEKARGFMDQGLLVPDELVLDMLFDRVSAEDCASGYLLDGFPRTLPQAEALDGRLGDASGVQAVNLEVEEETIVLRASGRLLCHGCDTIAHRKFKPPAKEGVCDFCGGELYQRDDDKPDVVRERLRVYHDQTAPLVGYYQSKGILSAINGERTPDEVFADLESLCLEGH
ncbi:MAG: adenylate kinase [Planctomycetota bacterium]|jgi:adenylate kinase